MYLNEWKRLKWNWEDLLIITIRTPGDSKVKPIPLSIGFHCKLAQKVSTRLAPIYYFTFLGEVRGEYESLRNVF